MKPAIKHTLLYICLLAATVATGQQSTVTIKADANKITVGDQARVFIEVMHNSKLGNLQWAAIPDTFNSLEVVEKAKVDTQKQGDVLILRQRLLVTGFDSGMFVIPSFQFSVIPQNGQAYVIETDSLPLLVQTVAVDTSKGFVGIKGIMHVKSSWKDYIWWIIGGLVLIGLAVFTTWYFVKK